MMATITTHMKTANQMQRTRTFLVHFAVGPTGPTKNHDVKKCEQHPRINRQNPGSATADKRIIKA